MNSCLVLTSLIFLVFSMVVPLFTVIYFELVVNGMVMLLDGVIVGIGGWGRAQPGNLFVSCRACMCACTVGTDLWVHMGPHGPIRHIRAHMGPYIAHMAHMDPHGPIWALGP